MHGCISLNVVLHKYITVFKTRPGSKYLPKQTITDDHVLLEFND